MITIRPGAAADVDTVRSLARDAFAVLVPTLGQEPAAMTADYARLTRAGHVRVALDSDRIVGFAVVREQVDHLLLETLAVRTDAARRGVGSVLLLHVEALAVTLGLGEVRLFAHAAMTENLDFVSRRGYAETDPDTGDAGRHVCLSKHF